MQARKHTQQLQYEDNGIRMNFMQFLNDKSKLYDVQSQRMNAVKDNHICPCIYL